MIQELNTKLNEAVVIQRRTAKPAREIMSSIPMAASVSAPLAIQATSDQCGSTYAAALSATA